MYNIMLTEHTGSDEFLIHGSPEAITSIGVRLNIGQFVGVDIERATFKYEKPSNMKLADNIAAPGFKCLLLQDRARNLFENLGVDNLQFFGLDLDDGRSPLKRCHMTNIIGHYDIIDYEKSELDMDDNGIEFIDSLSFIDTSELELPPIFRLSSFLPLIIVDDHIREAFEHHNITGFTFYKPEEFYL